MAMQPPTLSHRCAQLALLWTAPRPSAAHTQGTAERNLRQQSARLGVEMLTTWTAAAGLLTSPASSTRRATAASLRLCATLDEGLEVAVFAMG